MSVALRVAIIVLLTNFCIAREVVVFPGRVRNDFVLHNQNFFEIQTPLPADQVVAQALVEEVSGDGEENHQLDNEGKLDLNEGEENLQKENNEKREEIAQKNKKDQKGSETNTNFRPGDDHDKIAQVRKQYKGKKGHKSAKFGEKKGHKKGHKTKGYNNKFHKDEYHKEHKLYGDAYGNRNKNLYRGVHTNNANKEDGYNRSNHKTFSHSDNTFGRKGIDDSGKFDDQHKEFDKKSGHKNKNIHHTRQLNIKEETNPYPNHRPY